MDFSKPLEKRCVGQIAVKLQHLWGEGFFFPFFLVGEVNAFRLQLYMSASVQGILAISKENVVKNELCIYCRKCLLNVFDKTQGCV